MANLSSKVKERIRGNVPAGMYCYGGIEEEESRIIAPIKRTTAKRLSSSKTQDFEKEGREEFHDEQVFGEDQDEIQGILDDGKAHIIGATWCGACNMQKNLANGFFPLPVKNWRGKKTGQKWVKLAEMSEKVLKQIRMSKTEFEEVLKHALPEGAEREIVFHYIDDPDPEKRAIAEKLEAEYKPDGFPGFIRKKCDRKSEKPGGCIESGVKFKEAFVKFVEESKS